MIVCGALWFFCACLARVVCDTIQPPTITDPRQLSLHPPPPSFPQVLPIIGIALNGANVYGYVRCRYGAAQGIQSSISSATTSFMRDQVMKNVSGRSGTPEMVIELFCSGRLYVGRL